MVMWCQPGLHHFSFPLSLPCPPLRCGSRSSVIPQYTGKRAPWRTHRHRARALPYKHAMSENDSRQERKGRTRWGKKKKKGFSSPLSVFPPVFFSPAEPSSRAPVRWRHAAALCSMTRGARESSSELPDCTIHLFCTCPPLSPQPDSITG